MCFREEWKALPAMPNGRKGGHVCGIAVKSSSEKVVVVAGGEYSGLADAFDLKSENWRATGECKYCL